MEIINDIILDKITGEAAENPRLRKNFNLHTSYDEPVQRMLNALEPGTKVPVHRHSGVTETMIILRGSLHVNIYNREKVVVRKVLLDSGNGEYGVSIPAGEWHNVEALENGTVIFEVKEGPYRPITDEDIL